MTVSDSGKRIVFGCRSVSSVSSGDFPSNELHPEQISAAPTARLVRSLLESGSICIPATGSKERPLLCAHLSGAHLGYRGLQTRATRGCLSGTIRNRAPAPESP